MGQNREEDSGHLLPGDEGFPTWMMNTHILCLGRHFTPVCRVCQALLGSELDGVYHDVFVSPTSGPPLTRRKSPQRSAPRSGPGWPSGQGQTLNRSRASFDKATTCARGRPDISRA